MQTLEALRAGAYAGVKHLTLREGLTQLPPEVLELAPSLEVLDMSGNKLDSLPEEFASLENLRILFLSNNAFTVLPKVLGRLPRLEMIGFKANYIEEVPEDSLPESTRWLILTDNRIACLPASIGRLTSLQKLMLAGNRLASLPDSMSQCTSLELVRLAANQLESLPPWLLTLPRLSWLALAGNFSPPRASEPQLDNPRTTEDRLDKGAVLGEGASGTVYRAEMRQPGTSDGRPVAMKLFKGSVTSDGDPRDEMEASFAAGQHPNLIEVLAACVHDEQAGLLMEFLEDEFTPLGMPPSLASCTRDTFDGSRKWSIQACLRIAMQVADVMEHLHQRRLAHGDLYAHNLLVNPEADVLLSDFGAATLYPGFSPQEQSRFQRLEVRAFGCLLDDLLGLVDGAAEPPLEALSEHWTEQLAKLRDECLQPDADRRPDFTSLRERLQLLASLPLQSSESAAHSTETL